MNFSMSLNRLKNIILNPISEWEKIKSESISIKDIFIIYLLPLLLIGCSLKLIGRFLTLKDYNFIYLLSSCLSYFIISIIVILISSWVISEILPKFKHEKQFANVLQLVTFSLFPSIIFIGISSLHPDLTFINLFSVYSVIIFWFGITRLLQIPVESKIGFTLISLFIIILTTIVLSFILMPSIFSLLFLG